MIEEIAGNTGLGFKVFRAKVLGFRVFGFGALGFRMFRGLGFRVRRLGNLKTLAMRRCEHVEGSCLNTI